MSKLKIKEIVDRTISYAHKRQGETTITVYGPIAKNIYYNGHSFRVRVTKDYDRTSKNFRKLKEAIKYRNKLQDK